MRGRPAASGHHYLGTGRRLSLLSNRLCHFSHLPYSSASSLDSSPPEDHQWCVGGEVGEQQQVEAEGRLGVT